MYCFTNSVLLKTQKTHFSVFKLKFAPKVKSSLFTHIVWIQWVTDMAACLTSLKHLLVTLQSNWYSATGFIRRGESYVLLP